MFSFLTKQARKSAGVARPKAQLGVEALEERALMATSLITTPIIRVPPDGAGGTLATARPVALPATQWQSMTDYLPSSSDVDLYRITLNKGDLLIADIDRTSSVAPQSVLSLLDAAGNPINTGRVYSEPEDGMFTTDPAFRYYADGGTYYLKVTTSATDYSFGRGYQLNLERLGLEDSQSARALDRDGPAHVWLNQATNTLHVTGPTGYGFAMQGAWTKATSGSTVTYSVGGTVQLHTPYLDGAVGGIALQVPAGQQFSVRANAPGWSELGELTSTTGNFGLSLAPIASAIQEKLGIDVSQQAVMSSWTIKTGEQVRAAFPQYDVNQVLDGVPYLVSGTTGRLVVEFGQLKVTTGDQDSLLFIADPADPMLYVHYQDYAVAGSLNGRLPFNTMVQPTSDVTLGQSLRNKYYGHVFAHADFPISGLPLTVDGDLTVNLDANNDGVFLGGAGNAAQLLSGDLGAIEGVMRDINIGANGSLDFGYKLGSYSITVPLAQGSLFYSGPEQGVWFKGVQGTALNPWAGTPLADFQVGPGATYEGYLYRDGRFSVSATSSYQLFTMNASLTFTVSSGGTVASTQVSAVGKVFTPIATVDVSGTVALNGDFNWTGHTEVNIGDSHNYLRTSDTCQLSRTGSQLRLFMDSEYSFRAEIPGVAMVKGTLEGTLELTVDQYGHLHYEIVLAVKEASFYTWNPFINDWNKWGSCNDMEVGANNDEIWCEFKGHRFAIDLP